MLKPSTICFALFLLIAGHYAMAQKSGVVNTTTAAVDSIVNQQKGEVRTTLNRAKEEVVSQRPHVDTIPKIQKPVLEKPRFDSVGVSYENGKFNLPKQMPGDINKESLEKSIGDRVPGEKRKDLHLPGVGAPDVPNIPDENDLKEALKRKADGRLENAKSRIDENKIKIKKDSITRIINKGQELLADKNLVNTRRVYSEKALKRIYDSLGISRIDSVMALVTSKKEISKEDLLDAINYSGPRTAPITDAEGLKNAAKTEDISELKDQLPVSDLSKVKLPDSLLRELPPMHGFQFPADKFKLLDSMRSLNLAKEKLSLKEQDVKENIEKVIARPKPRFWDKTYFEGIVGYLKHKESNVIQVAPSLGYHVSPNFSLGVGPNIQLKETDKKWSVYVGYRAYLKAEVFRQRGYLQVEDNVDPGALSDEFIKGTHSILTGGGVLVPISGRFSLNFAVLYRVNNEQYSGNSISPWVFRVGLSSSKSVKK